MRHTFAFSQRPGCTGQHGFSLVYVVLALTVVATLATITVSVTSTAQFTQLREHNTMQARYMAMAGLSYLNSHSSQHRKLKDLSVDVKDDEDNVIGKFTFVSIQRLTSLKVRAGIRGTVGEDTSMEANYYLEGEAQEDFSGIASSNQDDFDDFTVTNSNPNKQGTEKVDGLDDIAYSSRASRGSASKSSGQTSDGTEDNPWEVEGPNAFAVGAGEYNNFGIATFTGNRTFKYTTCVDGECDFFLGLRFFMTVYYEKNDADGLVITLFNGDNNTNKAVGGDSQHGEMIAYAGDSRVLSSGNSYPISKFIDPEANGIQPPKLGVEIDNYGNPNRYICSDGTKSHYWFRRTNPTSGSRYDYGGADAGSGTDHVAYVGWGLDVPWGCAWYNSYSSSVRTANSGAQANEAGARTYDDNQHARESWMWNPWQYHYPVEKADTSLLIQQNTRRAVAQTFYVEEPLRITQAHLYLKSKTGINKNRNFTASIYTTTSSGGNRIPQSSVVSSLTGNDQVTDATLPTGSGGTDDSIYADGIPVLVSFQFSDKWNHASSKVLAPGWYALVLEYSNNNSHDDIYVQADSSSPTHPGNYAYKNSSDNWVADASIDLPFYVLFDPPHYVRQGTLANGDSETFYSGVFPVVNGTSYDDGGETQGNTTAWYLKGQWLAIRVEVHRGIDNDPDATVTDGKHGDNNNPYHPYRMLTWMRRCGTEKYKDGCDAYINSYFADTSGDLSIPKNPPAMDRTFYLNESNHNKFDTFYLGITEATGGSTQKAHFSNIIMQFREPDDLPLNVRACENCNDFDD
ncbi:hypothetical protein [Megalodesulfovibrio paquesii]